MAESLIEKRKRDGSNQYGFRSSDGTTPYQDYTNYQPINSADVNVDINRWQPKYFISNDNERYAPGCLTPYWQKVTPPLPEPHASWVEPLERAWKARYFGQTK